jgi:glycosyltransferase involved in cell wall biosynthesis
MALVGHLDPARWRAEVCGQTQGHLSAAFAEIGVPYHVVKTGWWRKGKYFLWRPFAIARLAALIRELNVDLVHCNEIYPNPYAIRAVAMAAARLNRRIPVVTHMRLSVTQRMIRNYALGRADRIVVPSEAAGRDFDVWPDKDRRVRVIHNGVDLVEFRRSRSAVEARRIIGAPGDGPLMAAIGQIGPRKGGDLILRAFALVLAEHPAARLMFVGNPHRGQDDFADGLRRLAEQPPLRDHVFFFPYTKQILPYYEAADINLLISREEGFGRTIIEAACFGLPSIGTHVGGIPELIAEGRTGLLIESENHVQLADSMSRLLSDPALAARLGENAFRHVAQHFSISSHAAQMMDLYDSLVE